jgi:hypothetical protein
MRLCKELPTFQVDEKFFKNSFVSVRKNVRVHSTRTMTISKDGTASRVSRGKRKPQETPAAISGEVVAPLP